MALAVLCAIPIGTAIKRLIYFFGGTEDLDGSLAQTQFNGKYLPYGLGCRIVLHLRDADAALVALARLGRGASVEASDSRLSRHPCK